MPTENLPPEDLRVCIEMNDKGNPESEQIAQTTFKCGIETRTTPLHRAAQLGDANRVRELLDEGADPDERDSAKLTALSIAIREDHDSVVEVLLTVGNENFKGRDQVDDKPGTTTPRLVLENGATIDQTGPTDEPVIIYASGASCVSIVKRLLDRGANPNAVGKFGIGTPLHSAARRNRPDNIECLVHQGADVNLAEGGKTPLHQAALCGSLEATQCLLKNGAKIDRKLSTPLFNALKKKHRELAKLLIQASTPAQIQGNNSRDELLGLAVETGDAVLVKLLLEKKAPLLNNRVLDQMPPLWLAVTQNNAEITRMLIDAGASPDGKFVCGRSSLWFALSHGHDAVCKILLEPLLKENLTQRKGGKLLWTAIHGGRCKEEVYKLLFENGVDPTMNHFREQTNLALVLSRDYDDKPSRGVLKVSRPPDDDSESLVKLLFEAGAEPNGRQENGDYPLTLAVNKWQPRIIELLLEKGANPDLINEDGKLLMKRAKESQENEIVRTK